MNDSSGLTILLHSSKTVQSPKSHRTNRMPLLINQAQELQSSTRNLSVGDLMKVMHISSTLAESTHQSILDWHKSTIPTTTAIDSFAGDIYSGLRAGELSKSDREYADRVLVILSGLYGLLRPLDGIRPYRLEMGYRFPDSSFKNMYSFWGDQVAKQLPETGTIVNISSVEYTRAVLPFIDSSRVVTPKFLTVSHKTGKPVFTAVHAKIARGAFARWLITSRITDPARFPEFNDLGYEFNKTMSTANGPVFICKVFGGIGLSIRRNK